MPSVGTAAPGKRRSSMSRPAKTKQPRKTKTKGPSEFQIHTAVVKHLEWRGRDGVFWFHPANGSKRSKAEAGKLKAMGVVAGVPDLIVMIDGRCHGLELKSGKGRLSDAQKVTIPNRVRAGCTVSIADNVDDAISVLAAWGAFKC